MRDIERDIKKRDRQTDRDRDKDRKRECMGEGEQTEIDETMREIKRDTE